MGSLRSFDLTDLGATESEFTSLYRRFRTVRIRLEDLEVLEGLEDAQLEWMCSQTKKSSFGVETTKYLRVGSLAELAALAPTGKIYHLQLRYSVGDEIGKMELGSEGEKSRWLYLASIRRGVEPPTVFRDIASLVELVERRSVRWHETGVVVVTTASVCAAFLFFAVTRNAFQWFFQEFQQEDILLSEVLAAVLTLISTIGLFPLVGGGFAWFASSSAVIRPRLSTASLRNKLRGLASWMIGLYADRRRLTLTVSILSMVFTAGGCLFGMLAWLATR